MASSSPLILLLLLSTTLFFLLFPPNHPLIHSPRRRFLLQSSPSHGSACSSPSSSSSSSSSSIINYSSLPLPLLSLLLLLHFYSLIRTASHHFSPVVTRLSSLLRLSPSMAAVTLLALGNGAPDLFSSAAALRRGNPRTGLAAILSAGAFVSSFVVGSVALLAAPFPLDPAPFVRDVFFYLLAASALFFIYLTAQIFLWQAIAFIAFYAFFVGLVFWMDLGRRTKQDEIIGSLPVVVVAAEDSNSKEKEKFRFFWISKISKLWEVPVTIILKLTIPSILPSSEGEQSRRFYTAANICLCPLAILYSFNSFIATDTPVVLVFCFPLWLVVLFVSLCLAVAYYFFLGKKTEAEAEQKAGIITLIVAFVMSVFWISTMAGELLNCLATVGSLLDLPPGILGLTVLAWGNSVGDLVSDVALAKAGQPAMAMAGCFVGPMFNMLVGLGSAMLIESAKVYPEAYELRFHASIVVAFVFLLLSLMGSLLVVTWHRFRVPRFWGFCLVGLYLLFTTVSLAFARFAG